MPIKAKLLLFTTAVSFVALLLASAGFLVYDGLRSRKALVKDISAAARLIADRSSAALLFDDAALAQDNLRALRAKTEIAAACVYDGNGAVFAGYNSAAGGAVECPSAAGAAGYSFGPDSLTVLEPILADGRRVGAVYIHARLDELKAMRRDIMLLAAVMLLFMLGLVYLLAARLQGLISGPLTRLTATARVIASKKDYGVRAVRGGRDEVGTLVDAFNEMLDAIQARDQENKQLNAELEDRVLKRTAQLEAATRAKGVFLASMSHEIRTPLNAILGFSQLLRRDPDITPAQVKQVETINRSGRHLLALINDVLEMSKIDAGRSTLNTSAFDLAGLLADLELMFRQRAEAKGLQLSVERGAGIPQYVFGDEGKLRQVLINLLGNAVKFTSRGGVILRASAAPAGEKGYRFVAEVEDTGPGMEASEFSALFSPFEQARAGKEAGGGTGLGLAISREYARLMGGDITASSVPGKGSVFRLEAALTEASAAAAALKEESRRVKRLAPGQPPCRVLIADDKEDNREFLRQLLTATGFEVRQAVNGEAAVKAFEDWRPHLVLMDIKMPVMDGYEATRRIRALPGGREMRIMVLSASSVGNVRQDALAQGADDYLGKPFREGELFEKMRRLLGLQYVYEEDGAPAGNVPAAARFEPGALSGLPAELAKGVREAAVSGDFDRLAGLADEAARTSPEAGAALRALAARFDSRGVLKLLGDNGQR